MGPSQFCLALPGLGPLTSGPLLVPPSCGVDAAGICAATSTFLFYLARCMVDCIPLSPQATRRSCAHQVLATSLVQAPSWQGSHLPSLPQMLRGARKEPGKWARQRRQTCCLSSRPLGQDRRAGGMTEIYSAVASCTELSLIFEGSLKHPVPL